MGDGGSDPGERATAARSGWRRRAVAALRAWQRSDLRGELAERRLRLAGLPRGTVRLVILAGVVAIGLALLLLGRSLSPGEPPSLAATFAFVTHAVPAPTVVGLLVGFAMIQILVVRVAGLSSGRRRVVLAATVVALGAVPLVVTVRLVDLVRQVYDRSPGVLVAAEVALVVVGVPAAIAGAWLTVRGSWLASLFAVAPALLLSGFWIHARLFDATLSGSNDFRFPEQLPLSTVISTGVTLWGFSVAGTGMAITLWLVVEATRATRDGATAAAVTFGRFSRAPHRQRRYDPWTILAAAVAIKLSWVALCLAGSLPAWLGGRLEIWNSIRRDGWLSWVLAAVVAGSVAAWLLRGCPGLRSGGHFAPTIALVVVGLTLPEFAYQALAQLYALNVGEWAFDAAVDVESIQPWAAVAVIVACCVAAAWRWARGRRDLATVFLSVFGLWGIVRVPSLVSDLVRYPWFPWGASMPTEFMYGSHRGWVGIATVDVALSAVLIIVALIGLRGGPIRFVPTVLIALAMTIVVYPGLLVNAVLSTAFGNAAAFVLPIAYFFSLDAKELNQPSIDRERRVLRVVALAILALTIGSLRGYFGDPVAEQDAALGAELLVMPALVTAVVSMAGTRARVVTITR